MIHVLGSVLVVVSAVEAVACALLYGLGFRWWTSGEGRHLFSFMGVIAVTLGLWTVFLLSAPGVWSAPPSGPREYARAVTFALIAWVIGWRLALVIKAKRPTMPDKLKRLARRRRKGR